MRPQQTSAQTYPSRPITIVVSFAAGGFVDTVARLVGQKLSERLGKPVVVENRPGAGGNIAHRYVAAAQPDGYTLLAASTAIAINESLYANRGYQGSDFTTVAMAASTPEVLVTNAAGPKTLKEVVELSKTRPVTFGTAGTGSASYIVTEYFFKDLAKGEATHVPFQGGAPALNAILANQIDLAAAAVAGGFVPHLQSGALRGLAAASAKRFPPVPDMPTYAENGYPGFTALSWAAFFAPARTARAYRDQLNAAIGAIMRDPQVISRITPAGYDPMYGSPAEADAVFRTDIEKWRKMVNGIGLQIN